MVRTRKPHPADVATANVVASYASGEDHEVGRFGRADRAIKADLREIDAYADGVTLRYLRKTRTFGSVTPLVLPGRDDFRTRKAHALVLKALAQAGYTTPVVEITLQREPVFPGAEVARAYRVPAYLKEFPRTHAIINFAEDVPGPLAIGAGRHIGHGLFAALA